MNPFDQAWILLKESRQTELGEHYGFEDEAFSSYGPITHYHGTTGGPAAAIESQGLQPRLPYEAQLNQAQMAARLQGLPVKDWDPEGVYASKRQKEAEKYANWRGQDRNQAPTVFGIRGGGLDFQSTAPDGYLGYYPEAVPRSRLVRVQ